MSPAREVGVGIIGLGFMGRMHLAAFRAARADGFPCRLVGFCDHAAAHLPAEAERNGAFACTDAAELLAQPEVELVSICTRTDTHVDLAIAALEAGKHVLVEKPIGITADDVAKLAVVANEVLPVRCVPAHCMRFWPGWDRLREAVLTKRYGRVLSATFHRLSSRPSWSSDFYGNPRLSGGALIDLHLHDADFIRWCFGDPVEVTSTGSLDHVTTIYRYGKGGPPHVVAEGGWDHTPSFGFRMSYLVVFEEATLDFEYSRVPRLLIHRNGKSEMAPILPHLGYDGEVRHVLDLLSGEAAEPIVTVDDALALACLLDAERESLQTGRPVVVG